MHRALKVLLNTPIRTKSILKFNTKMEVLEIMNLADDLDKNAYECIYEHWKFYLILVLWVNEFETDIGVWFSWWITLLISGFASACQKA